MNLKLSPRYILSFLILLFLVQQFHDWAHILTVRATCHCWGHRVFETWELCGSPSSGQHALISISGPLINFVLLWVGWSLLHPENAVEENSVGVALVFAALPLDNLAAAINGGGDLTEAIRWIQQHGPMSNHRFVTRLGLVLMLLLVIPPLVRAFMRLPGYKGKLIAFPLLFLVPGWLTRWWSKELTHWFIPSDATMTGTYLAVGIWTVLLAVGCFFTARWLRGFIRELTL